MISMPQPCLIIRCKLFSRGICALLLAVTMAVPCLAAALKLALIRETIINDRLQAGRVPASQREEVIRNLFLAAGCQSDDQRVDKKHSNVICTLPGQTDDTIIVAGHSDFVDRGKGIVDDWSGTALLPSLYEALKGEPRRHTF